MTPRLVIFDMDGTLIDSQAHITASMEAAFAANDLTPPTRAQTLSIVGLSLPVAMAVLAPDHPGRVEALVAAYKDAFTDMRRTGDGSALSPLFPGALDTLRHLHGHPDTALAVATGKSRRGLDHVFDLHDLRRFFLSVQVADDHPSKPHPSMIEACLRDTGVEAANAAIVGDTTYDIDMGRAGGIQAIGVTWGYHPPGDLARAGAAQVIETFDALPATLDRVFSPS